MLIIVAVPRQMDVNYGCRTPVKSAEAIFCSACGAVGLFSPCQAAWQK